MKFHIKKNDTAVILAGKDRGKQGKVLMVDGKKRVATIEGLNLHKKHTKQNPQMKIKGGILEHESPIPLSRLAPWCAHCKKPGKEAELERGKSRSRGESPSVSTSGSKYAEIMSLECRRLKPLDCAGRLDRSEMAVIRTSDWLGLCDSQEGRIFSAMRCEHHD